MSRETGRELNRVHRAVVPQEKSELMHLSEQMTGKNGFVSFRYSSTEISSPENGLHVKMKQTRFQDGRLLSEECEGTLDRNAYNRVVSEAQGQFLRQMAGFVGLLLAPFVTRSRRDDER